MARKAMHSLSYALVRTFVRQRLESLKNDPERSARSLVDMALHFSTGRFQTHFFQVTQSILENEQSSYYHLIQDAVTHVDTDHLITLGMNMGYNSLTAGARIIRKEWSSNGLAVPWAITLQLDPDSFENDQSAYCNLINQGEALGIFTWILFAPAQPEVVLPLICNHDECSFFLFLSPSEITDDFLSAASSLHNLMVSVEMCSGADLCCSKMRSRQMLYGIHTLSSSVLSNTEEEDLILYDACALHPLITFFVSPEGAMTESQKNTLYTSVLSARCRQEFTTVPVDLWGDFHRINTMICENAHEAVFRPDGSLVSSSENVPLNFHRMSLREILRQQAAQRSPEMP